MKHMKRNLFTLIALGLSSMTYAQVNKVPMIEHFTQASCGPCASQNPAMKTTLDGFSGDYVKISHQVSWPGYDPMYDFFPTGPDARVSFYGITGVPNTSLNGGSPGAPNTIVTNSTLTSAAATMTPYDITVTQSWPDANTIDLDIDVTNVTGAAISSADKIYIAMVENVVDYGTAPGSNGETIFYNVMREMYTTTGAGGATTGSALGTIAGSATENFSFTISSLPSYISDKAQVTFAVFVQNNGTKEIMQAGKSSVVAIPGIIQVAAASASTVSSDLCDYGFTPAVEFTNNDAATPVTEVVAEYQIDGGTAVQQTFTGNLTQGQSTTIAFPAATLNPGTTTVSYTIVSVNGGQDWSSPAAVSIADETFSKLSSTGVAAPVAEGMENSVLEAGTGYSREITTGFFEAGSIALSDFCIVDGPAYSYGAHGGFGNSDRCIRARFYNLTSGTMSLTMDKINLGANSELTFSHAYRQYAAENDRLKVLVSTDCGASWDEVYNEAGSSLATLAAATAAYNTPAAGDWESNTVDLSAYDNTDDVVVKFEMTSAYGNNLFLDDINIKEAGVDGIDEVNQVEFSVYPNPASEQFTVKLGQDIQSEIQILDVQGKVVSAQVVAAGQSTVIINAAGFEAGIYTVLVKTENGVSVQKIVVQ